MHLWRPFRFSLAWRWTLLFALAALLPLLMGGGLALRSSYAWGQQEANRQQQLVAGLASNLIAVYLEDILTELRGVATLGGVRPLEAALPLANLCQQRRDRYYDLAVTDETGQELAHFVQCRAVPVEELTSRAATEPFFRARRGTPFVGTVSFSPAAGPLVRVSVQMETEAGPRVALAQVSLADLWELLSKLEISAEGYIYIVDKRGTLIGYQDPALVQQNLNLATLPTVAALVNRQTGLSGQQYVGLLGEPVVGTSVFIPEAHWGLVVEQPVAALFAEQDRLSWRLRYLLAAVAVISVGGAWLLSQPLTRSIRALAQGAEAVARGDFSHRLPVTSADEVGAVSEAFNLMTARLRELVFNLEQQVAALEQAEATLRRQLRELSVLHAVAVAGAAATDETALGQQTVEIIGTELYEGDVGLLLWDETTGALRLQALYPRPATLPELLIPLGEGITGQVALSGQAQRVSDTEQATGYVRFNPATRAELCVPLKVGERVLGVLNVESPQLEAFSEADEQLLTTLAGQLATALDRLRADALQQRQMRQLTTIYDVGRRITSILTLDKLLPEVVHLIGGALQLYNVEIALKEQERLVFRAGCGGYAAGRFEPGLAQRLDEGVVGRVASTGQPLLVPDVSQYPPYVPLTALPKVRAEAAVPLQISGQVIGVLDVKSDRVGGITADTLATLQILADQVAVAVQTAQLFEELQRQTRELAALYNAAIATSNVLETDLLLQRLYEQVEQLLHPDACLISLYETDTGSLDLALAAEGGQLHPERVGERQPLKPGEGADWLWRQRRPLLIGDLATEPAPPGLPLPVTPMRTALAVPLVVRGRLVGLLALYSAQPQAFHEVQSRFVESLAGQVAVALENARLFQSTLEASRQQTVLHWASQEIASAGLDLQRVYQAIYQATGQLMPTEAFVLAVLDERRGDIEVVYHVDRSGLIPPCHIPLHGTLSGHVIGTGRPFISGNLAQERTVQALHFGASERVVSVLAVPLQMQGRTLGMLSAQSYRPQAYTTEDLHRLDLLAVYAAAALQNARLFAMLRRQLQELTVLHAVAVAGAEASDETMLIERATQLLGETLYPDNFGVILLDEARQQLIIHPSYRGLDAAGLQVVLAVGQGVTGRVAQTGQPWRIADVTREPVYVAVGQGMRSELCVPLWAGAQLIGVVNAESQQPDAYSEADERLLVTFAGQLGTAIARVRLLAELTEALGREQRLNEMARLISSALELPTLLERVTHLAAELIRADLGGLALLVPDRQRLEYASLWNLEAIAVGDPVPPGQGSLWRVFVTGQSILRCSPSTDELPGRAPWEVPGVQSCLVVPVVAGEQRIGVLALGSRRPDQQFTGRDLALAESIGRQAGVAIQNARLFVEAQQRATELAVALQKLQELDRLKSEFIQNVSHELRTPLAIIRGYVELLEGGNLGELKPEQQEPVAIISRRVQMLTKMVGDLTAILEAETQRMHYEVVDMIDLVQTLASDFRGQAEKAGLRLAMELPATLPPVWGDIAHLKRVVDNLVGNALKFTPAGGTITLRLSQAGEQVVLEVADTGIGIPADKVQRIFDRFYQVDGSASRRYGGTGLGLALVKEIVQAHQGTVTVTSQVGQGSTFRITLPVWHGRP